MAIDRPIYNAPKTKDRIKLASESAIEEFELELPGLIKAWEEWQKDNPGGSFRDFLDSSEPKRQKLNEGGKAESYADLIDAYQKGIGVMPDETLTQYIRRVRMAELENAYRGMD